MLDDRVVPRSAKGVSPRTYWAMAAALNVAYAARFGYAFRFVRWNRSAATDYISTWGKVFYMAHRLKEVQNMPKCFWLLFLDTDAYVREFDVPLHVFLGGLASRYKIREDVAAIFAQEQPISRSFGGGVFSASFTPKRQWVNTGVFFVQSNSNSRFLFDEWLSAGKAASQDVKLKAPAEMGILTDLVRPDGDTHAQEPTDTSEKLKRSVATVNMVEMNSPWGRFVQHIWSYHWYRREVDFWDALVRIDVGEADLSLLLRLVHRHMLNWGPSK